MTVMVDHMFFCLTFQFCCMKMSYTVVYIDLMEMVQQTCLLYPSFQLSLQKAQTVKPKKMYVLPAIQNLGTDKDSFMFASIKNVCFVQLDPTNHSPTQNVKIDDVLRGGQEMTLCR